MISVREIATQKELTDFVKFPLSLYENNPYWVPPLINDKIASFSKDENPVFERAQVFFFLAYNEQKQVVGHVAAIINQNDLRQGIKKMRFRWLDMIGDLNVIRALIQKVAEKGHEHQLDYIEGPMDFSSMDKVELLTDSYDYIANMMTWYHHPYYKKHLTKLGFEKEKGFIDMSSLSENPRPGLSRKTAEAIRRRYGMRLIDAPIAKEVLKHVDTMFNLYSETYSRLASYVSVNNAQRNYSRRKYIPFINPEYIRLIKDKEGKLISFAMVMPSFSKALQKAKGRLFPFGFWHLLKAKEHHGTVEFYLIGVAPEYRSKGIPALLFNYYYNVFKRNGVTKRITTPELEENLAIQQLWKNFDPVIFARRATFKLTIDK